MRKLRRADSARDGPGADKAGAGGVKDVRVSFRERLREGQNANEQIERVYGELRGIERAARPRALSRGRG